MNRKRQVHRSQPTHHSLSKSDRANPPNLESVSESNEDATSVTYHDTLTRCGVHDGNNMNINSLWTNALIHHEQTLKDKRAQREYHSLLCLPGSTVLPRATLSSLHGKSNKIHKTEAEIKPSKKGPHPIHNSNGNSFQRKYAPYIDANTKIRHALSLRKPFQTREELLSKQLEQFMILTEKEAKAAVVLQSYWRRYKAIRYLAELKFKQVCAIRIQAFIRGVLVRVQWKEWKRQCHLYAIKCQAQVRRQIATRKWNAQKELERQKATIIQACIRSFLCKCEYLRLLQNCMATKIQRLWRGKQGRLRFLQTKLDFHATIIQTSARRHLAYKKYIRILQEKTGAVVEIQRCWRGHVSRSLFSELLYERSVFWRKRQILMYKADLEYVCKKMDKTRRHIYGQDPTKHKEMLCQKIEECKRDIDSKRQELAEEEKNYSDLQYTKESLTPNDVERGWLEQIENSVKDSIARITNLKLSIVFKGIRRLKEVEEALERHETLFAEMDSEISRLQSSVDQWTKEFWNFQRQHDQKKQSIRYRQSIADEKRKWKVQPLSASGKPLKRKQGPSKGLMKEKDCTSLIDIATVDLLADENVKDNVTVGERIDQLIDQVMLSLNRNQTQQYHSTLGLVEKLFEQYQNHFSKF